MSSLDGPFGPGLHLRFALQFKGFILDKHASFCLHWLANSPWITTKRFSASGELSDNSMNCKMKDIDKILFSVERIKERVRQLGEAISKDYEGKDRVLCLRGAAMCGPDALHLDYFGLHGYLELHRRGAVQGLCKILREDLEENFEGKEVIVDIAKTDIVPESCH